MFEKILAQKKIAILATDGFEQSELLKPKEALENAGAQVHLISIKSGTIKSWSKDDWGKSVAVDKIISEVSSNDYDAVMIPGGVINPDKLRCESKVVQFLKEMMDEGKPVAAICHGPQILIETNLLHGKTMTSWHSIKTDLQNAGVMWVDQEVVVDKGLVTSRSPDDIPAFIKKMIEEFAEGIHEDLSNDRSPSMHANL